MAQPLPKPRASGISLPRWKKGKCNGRESQPRAVERGVGERGGEESVCVAVELFNLENNGSAEGEVEKKVTVDVGRGVWMRQRLGDSVPSTSYSTGPLQPLYWLAFHKWYAVHLTHLHMHL